MPLLEISLGLALLLCWVGLVVVRGRNRMELRARLLEVLARATDRGLSLAPLFACAAEEQTGKTRARLEDVKERLMGGATLGDACAALFPFHVVGAIRSAEGTAALPRTLDAAAGDTVDGLALRHRALLTVLYPTLIGLAIVAVQVAFMGRFAEINAEMDSPSGAWVYRLVPVAGQTVLALVGAGLATAWVLRRACRLPGAQLLAAERWLRAAGPLVTAGESLSAALRRAAPACGNRCLTRELEAAATRVESGTALTDAFAGTRLPSFVRARLAAATLSDLAEECARRYAARSERFLNWAGPASVALLGLVAALQFATITLFLGAVQGQVGLW